MDAVLLAFVSGEDPWLAAPVEGVRMPGPVLALTASRSYSRCHLFSFPAAQPRAAALQAELTVRGVPAEVVELPGGTGAEAMALVRHLQVQVARWDGAPLTVLLEPAPAPSRAAWLYLAQAGLLRAELLDVQVPRFPTDRPLFVRRVDQPAGPGPRQVREPSAAYAVEAPATVPASAARDLELAVRELGLCATHPAMVRALDMAEAVAPHPVPVLIRGETGTGKSLLARLIHRLSGRRADRFVSVNCAALPEHLVESLLFGHRKGAFTGAAADQAGKFELADGGTLFLDEIGELPLARQPKLLKVLDDGLVEPLGSRMPHKVDVRVVAATHRDLARAVAERTFREDLFYRISFTVIHLPPLRERREDIHRLALHILDRFNRTLPAPRCLTPAALARLESHPWPGNVRDLENVIGRSILLTGKDRIDAADLLIESPPAAPLVAALPEPHENFSLEQFLDDARRQLINRALEIAGGRQSDAARLLGISPQAVSKFLQKERIVGNPG